LHRPSKIPELARALGRAKKEFELAQKEYTDTSSPTQNTSNNILLDTARKLGIRVEGKDEQQIANEIIERVKDSKK
jgi:sec-independent protein translocase protein TatA